MVELPSTRYHPRAAACYAVDANRYLHPQRPKTLVTTMNYKAKPSYLHILPVPPKFGALISGCLVSTFQCRVLLLRKHAVARERLSSFLSTYACVQRCYESDCSE